MRRTPARTEGPTTHNPRPTARCDLLPWRRSGGWPEFGWMSRHQRLRLAAWFQNAIGVSVIGWWTMAAATNRIPELEEGRIDIVFHIAAELVMAALLIAGGVSSIRHGRTLTTTMISHLALGTLLYSSINSPGYFAEQRAWRAVGMFAVLGAATVAILMMTQDVPETGSRAHDLRHRGTVEDHEPPQQTPTSGQLSSAP